MKRTNNDDGPNGGRLSYSNPRTSAEVADWPFGRQTCRARFTIESKVGHGERVARVTENKSRTGWNKPKRTTYSRRVIIVDGSDGRLYLISWSAHYGHISVTMGTMMGQVESCTDDGPEQERYRELLALIPPKCGACGQVGTNTSATPLLHAPGCPEQKTIWNDDGTDGPVLICPPPEPVAEELSDYDLRFRASPAGRQVKAVIMEQQTQGHRMKLRRSINNVTENIYQRLPSGDYGRGDVRRYIMALVGVTVDASNRYSVEQEGN